MEDGHVLKIRGLPWSATKEDILKFFEDCNILKGKDGIHLIITQAGRPSGEAFIEFESEEDKEKGLKKDKEHMGHRYIEVFEASRSDMELTLRRSKDNEQESQNSNCVKLRGLPFDCSKEEIVQFFSGLEIVPNGVTLNINEMGKQTGDAYVEFRTAKAAELALQKHKEKIGHRYIEVFRCSPDEMRNAQFPPYEMRPLRGPMRPTPYDMPPRGPIGRGRGFDPQGYPNPYYRFQGPRGDFNGAPNGMGPSRFGGPGPLPSMSKRHSVHMRGLPFRATKRDIQEFFHPIPILDMRLIFEKGGKPSGEAEVLFHTHQDAVDAMKKDKAYMQTRYIELFLNSTPDYPDKKDYSNASSYGSSGNFGSPGNFGKPVNFGNDSMRGGGGGYGGGNMGGWGSSGNPNMMPLGGSGGGSGSWSSSQGGWKMGGGSSYPGGYKSF